MNSSFELRLQQLSITHVFTHSFSSIRTPIADTVQYVTVFTMLSSSRLLLLVSAIFVWPSPATSQEVFFEKKERNLQQQCVDSNASCRWWASQGECDLNPGYMRSNCALSCNTCTPVLRADLDPLPPVSNRDDLPVLRADPDPLPPVSNRDDPPVLRADPDPFPPVSDGAATVPTPEQWLSAANAKRRCHGGQSAELVWDAGLARSLERHLSSVVESGRCTNVHDNQIFPEILYSHAGGDVSTLADTAVNWWYGEIRNYDFTMPGVNDFTSNPTPNTNAQTGHFRSLVWLGMTRLGCATVECTGPNGASGRFLTGCRLADRPYDASNLPSSLCGEPGDYCIDPDGSVHRRNVLPSSCFLLLG
uniref:ShKT domain-containing protein n=1 Tax=Chromera velia CCMP2878 TaxID=1169474 RepID=A0A0G4FR84_9ALVE|eukprot:Cvel_18198.t1-p1 / transcript=Cvel_18198.t1 / gene=Cvel_18198 / organism=Chromera_velia_CCMP2878 / gene_product=Protein PRY1, putative / transcript_product=Protein PRY1, putative / location=Cvel_scaffold1493:32305-33807(+) / protein_length=361 / sequence_SO=supercontig / SO=protein_coding / is_pseudo=false